MKKHLIIMVSVLSLALLVTACAPRDQGGATGQACQEAGGEWLSSYNECEGVSESWCQQQGGSFEQCASACRHDPNTDVCTMQCVPVCSFE